MPRARSSSSQRRWRKTRPCRACRSPSRRRSGASSGTICVARLAARPGCGPSARGRRCAARARRAARLAGGQSDRSGAVRTRACARPGRRPRARPPARAAIVGTMRLQQGHVVAQRLAEAAGLDEVALHVDDHQRRRAGLEAEGEGLRALDHAATAHARRLPCGVVLRAPAAHEARPACGGRRWPRRVSCTMRPSLITTMRSDSSSSSSRSSLTSSTAAPRVARRHQARVDLGHRGEVQAEHRVGHQQQARARPTARAPAPRAARCRPTACGSARPRPAS